MIVDKRRVTYRRGEFRGEDLFNRVEATDIVEEAVEVIESPDHEVALSENYYIEIDGTKYYIKDTMEGLLDVEFTQPDIQAKYDSQSN